MAAGDRSVNIRIGARDAASGVLSKIGIGIVGIGSAILVARTALRAFTGAINIFIGTAAAQEKADIALASALRTTGQNTAEARKRIEDLASELQDLTTIDDRVVKSVAGVLASLGELSGEGLERATRATVDFATALGIDTQAAALLVAKAAGGMTSVMSRYLGTIETKGLNKVDAFNKVLTVMEGKFEGLAEAQGRGFAGALARIANNFNDLNEMIGDTIIKSEIVITAFDAISTSIKGLQRVVQEQPAILNDLSRSIISLALIGSQSILALAEAMLPLIARFERAKIVFTQLDLTEVDFSEKTQTALELERAMEGLRKVIENGSTALRGIQAELDKTIELERLAKTEGFGTAEGLRAIQEIIRRRGGRAGSIPEALGKGELPGLADEVDEVADAYESLGISSLRKAEEAALSLYDKMTAVTEAFFLGDIDQERFDALSSAIFEAAKATEVFGIKVFEEMGPETADTIAAIAAGMREIGLAVEAGLTPLEQLGFRVEELNVVIGRELVNSALYLGDTLVDAFFGAKFAFEDFVRDVLRGFARMIVQALILKAIAGTAFGTFLGFGGGGEVPEPNIVLPQRGGLVRGGLFGRDSVLAALTPGEVVLPLPVAAAFQEMVKASRAMSDPGLRTGGVALERAPLQMFNRIDRVRDDLEVAELIEAFNEAAERKGFRIVATELIG